MRRLFDLTLSVCVAILHKIKLCSIPTLPSHAISRLFSGPLLRSVFCSLSYSSLSFPLCLSITGLSPLFPLFSPPVTQLTLSPPCNITVTHITDAVVPLEPGWKISPVFPSSPSSPPAGPPTPTPPYTATGHQQQLRNTT